MLNQSMKNGVLALAVLAMMGLSYSSGHADATDNMKRLNLTVDLLTKARSVLNATPVRQGYTDVEAAKQNIDKALASTQKAIVANGG